MVEQNNPHRRLKKKITPKLKYKVSVMEMRFERVIGDIRYSGEYMISHMMFTEVVPLDWADEYADTMIARYDKSGWKPVLIRVRKKVHKTS